MSRYPTYRPVTVNLTRDKGGRHVIRPPHAAPITGDIVLVLSPFSGEGTHRKYLPPALVILTHRAVKHAASVHVTGGHVHVRTDLANVLGEVLPPEIEVTWDDPHIAGVSAPATRRYRDREG